jgi:hypothetical protein
VSSRSAPAGASIRIPPSRLIDPRGQRFGAGVSAALLIGALALGVPWLAALVGMNLAISAAFGTRLFLPGRAWPFVRRTLGLGPSEPEHDYPPRFAQALGAGFIGAGALLFVVGLGPLGWLPILAVAALQALLAATGICVGCRLYVLRWWVPGAFAGLIGRTDGLVRLDFGEPLRRPDA